MPLRHLKELKELRELKLAVLIDADNVPYSNIKGMLDEITKIGIPSIKRIYGDWTKPTVSGWKQPLLEHAIIPVQQYSYTQGKNATDSAMIIDAMDILHNKNVDGFCLVSSDSDFTRLATRLRESGMLVVGMGERKTPRPFIVACDKFIYIEIIADKEIDSDITMEGLTEIRTVSVEPIGSDVIKLLTTTTQELYDDGGWASLAGVGSLVNKKRPDFDPRNYGYPKLTPLVKSLDKTFDIDIRASENNPQVKHIYVKVKTE